MKLPHRITKKQVQSCGILELSSLEDSQKGQKWHMGTGFSGEHGNAELKAGLYLKGCFPTLMILWLSAISDQFSFPHFYMQTFWFPELFRVHSSIKSHSIVWGSISKNLRHVQTHHMSSHFTKDRWVFTCTEQGMDTRTCGRVLWWLQFLYQDLDLKFSSHYKVWWNNYTNIVYKINNFLF